MDDPAVELSPGMFGGAARLACLALGLLAGCVSAPRGASHDPTLESLAQAGYDVYFLEFADGGGSTYSPALARARHRLQTEPPDRVIVASLGWGIDRATVYSAYLDFLDLFREATRDAGLGHEAGRDTVVLCVAWDSSQTGFRKFFNDLLPFHMASDVLAFVPDKLFFPVSFWSKAVQADRIGYFGLPNHMRDLFAGCYEDGVGPPVYSIGHSFGCRVFNRMLTRVRQERERGNWASAPGEHWSDHLAGSLMVLPAIARRDLEVPDDFPTVVVQSRHDHANAFLFPLANVVLNTSVGTMADREFTHVEAREGEEEGEPSWRRRLLADAVATPIFAFAVPLLYLPASYAIEQGRGVQDDGLDHAMHTLAHLPLVEIPVRELGAAVGKPWGRRKGALDLGLLTESVANDYGLLDVPGQEPIALTYAELEAGAELQDGLVLVDASDQLNESYFFGLDLSNRLVNYTVGWLDPVGAHNAVQADEVFELLRRIVTRPGAEDERREELWELRRAELAATRAVDRAEWERDAFLARHGIGGGVVITEASFDNPTAGIAFELYEAGVADARSRRDALRRASAELAAARAERADDVESAVAGTTP